MTKTSQQDYSRWSNEQLVSRVTTLEHELKEHQEQLKEQTERYKAQASKPSHALSSSQKPQKKSRAFDSSKYSTRFIALKFAYLGQNYNGLEYHPGNETRLRTVEEELWKALAKSKLVTPSETSERQELEPDFDSCGYSKCGRTDRGVSAFGQVVALRVRSNRPLPRTLDAADQEVPPDPEPSLDDIFNPAGAASEYRIETKSTTKAPDFNDRDELPYATILNRLLPPDIKILAWCPNPPPDFSARFSCRERRYKYFFTNPAFAPWSTTASPMPASQNPHSQPQSVQEGHLSIPAMRTAAAKFTGLHDFRNFCKIDPSKQLDNFERRIFHASIDEVNPPPSLSPTSTTKPPYDPLQMPTTAPNRSLVPSTPALYALTLHGSAFLWHQVRHMVAILFLIGQGLEPPSLIDDLLNIQNCPGKPHYEMADDAPLVLWDCVFPRLKDGEERQTESRPDALNWVHVGEEAGQKGGIGEGKRCGRDTKYGPNGLVPDLWQLWRKRKIDEVLAGSLLERVIGMRESEHHAAVGGEGWRKAMGGGEGQRKESTKIFLGGDSCKLAGKYVPVMQRPTVETPEVVNARYREREARKMVDQREADG